MFHPDDNIHNTLCFFVLYFFVVIAVIEFTILHPVLSCSFLASFSMPASVSPKSTILTFFSFRRPNDVLVSSSIITDTSLDSQALFLKVNVLPCKTTNLTDAKPCVICYLNWQYCWGILFLQGILLTSGNLRVKLAEHLLQCHHPKINPHPPPVFSA